ncbi:hypothetical protein NZNM25_01590 [Nitrosopumilus zosterae]|uniref:Uncharacterized protein n=1 Tax=Nitrosopumilus zosterae TaxID=718286 RepID=A0A2S2KPH1_9ARCH|nr:hypothetical protein [Nitrosopumilus zosterae]BDQ31155.1 hypothetical protein NZOSNM25_001266 [Nitrosopumilus zosterae]GBH33368.1 hypothetical protein NZNM25_01590 [Nitrosopumilus zosterae]
MSQTYDFVPAFKDGKPIKNASKDWLNFDEPQILFYQGMRGSGKSVMVDETVEKLYNQGFTILHIWGARSLENLYYAINNNCKYHYDKLKIIVDVFSDKTHQGNHRERCASKGLYGDEYEQYKDIALEENLIEHYDETQLKLTEFGLQLSKRELLHCNCHRAIPITVAVPDYLEFDQESLDRFNGFYFSDLKHYSEYFSEITTFQKELLKQGKLLIPEYARPKPVIKVQYFTTPTTADRKIKFHDEFTKIILDSRKEHRIVSMNPSLFDGEMDKFYTLAEIFKMMPNLMTNSGHFMPLTQHDVKKPRKYWTRKQKAWHKVAIVINEVRSVAPSSNLHGDKDAGISKKAVFGYVPEARHFKTWLLCDYQDPEDLYSGIKKQGNLTIVKRGSRNILGENFSWLFSKVEYDRLGLARRVYKKQFIEKIEQLRVIERKHSKLKKYLDDRRPYVDELPDNKAYVTWQNQEIKLITVNLPSWHHRQSTEDFLQYTGIRWTINKEKKPIEKSALSKKERKDASKNMKKIKDDIFKRINGYRKQGWNWTQIKDELTQLQNEGVIPNMEFEQKTPKALSNWYGNWKKKQSDQDDLS